VKYAACLALALPLCAVGPSRAEDKGLPGNYKDLKKLEPLIGAWSAEFVAPFDWPTANVKKGNKLTHTMSFKWDLNKSIISHRQAFVPPKSAPIWQSHWLIGWDTGNKRITCFAFENTGGHQVIDNWEIKGDKVTFKGKGTDPYGNKTTFTGVISDIKKDSFVWQMIDVTIAGKKRPVPTKETLKRAKAR
jgi:hypothetical protein